MEGEGTSTSNQGNIIEGSTLSAETQEQRDQQRSGSELNVSPSHQNNLSGCLSTSNKLVSEQSVVSFNQEKFHEDNPIWTEIMKSMHCVIDNHIILLLDIYGYRTYQALKDLDTDDIKEIEENVRSGDLADRVDSGEVHLYLGKLSDFKKFKFLPGERKLIKRIVKYISKNHQENDKPLGKNMGMYPLIKKKKSTARNSSCDQGVKRSTSDTVVTTDVASEMNSIRRLIKDFFSKNSFSDDYCNIARNLAIAVKTVENNDGDASLSCSFVCPLCSGKTISAGYRERKATWQLSNLNRHFKTHEKKNDKIPGTVNSSFFQNRSVGSKNGEGASVEVTGSDDEDNPTHNDLTDNSSNVSDEVSATPRWSDDDEPYRSDFDSDLLEKVVSWMTQHEIFEYDENVKKGWLAEILEVDRYMVFDLAMAAHLLDIKCMWNFICETMAGMMNGKKPEDIRHVFNLDMKCKDSETERIPDQQEPKPGEIYRSLMMKAMLYHSHEPGKQYQCQSCRHLLHTCSQACFVPIAGAECYGRLDDEEPFANDGEVFQPAAAGAPPPPVAPEGNGEERKRIRRGSHGDRSARRKRANALKADDRLFISPLHPDSTYCVKCARANGWKYGILSRGPLLPEYREKYMWYLSEEKSKTMCTRSTSQCGFTCPYSHRGESFVTRCPPEMVQIILCSVLSKMSPTFLATTVCQVSPLFKGVADDVLCELYGSTPMSEVEPRNVVTTLTPQFPEASSSGSSSSRPKIRCIDYVPGLVKMRNKKMRSYYKAFGLLEEACKHFRSNRSTLDQLRLRKSVLEKEREAVVDCNHEWTLFEKMAELENSILKAEHSLKYSHLRVKQLADDIGEKWKLFNDVTLQDKIAHLVHNELP